MAQEIAWESLDALTRQNPGLERHVSRSYFQTTGLLHSTDAAKFLVDQGAREAAEQLAVILEGLGQGFKARIIRENILSQQ